MDVTKKMVALMGEMRRERNGVVADRMEDRGCSSGLNYGVSLPTLRQIARQQEKDYDFARFLWQQDVRELRLAALHIAPQDSVREQDYEFWASNIRDGELAEEAGFALLSRLSDYATLYRTWVVDERPMVRYAALLGATRNPELKAEWVEKAVTAVKRKGTELENHLVAQGVVSMLSAVALLGDDAKAKVVKALDEMGDDSSEQFIRDEMSWRLC